MRRNPYTAEVHAALKDAAARGDVEGVVDALDALDFDNARGWGLANHEVYRLLSLLGVSDAPGDHADGCHAI